MCSGGRDAGGSGEAATQYVQAAGAMQKKEHATALYSLLVALNNEPDGRKDTARKLMDGIFALLGETNPLTQQYRPLVK